MGTGCGMLMAFLVIYWAWRADKKGEQKNLQARRERLKKFQETGDLADLAEDDITIIIGDGTTKLQSKNKLLHKDDHLPWG